MKRQIRTFLALLAAAVLAAGCAPALAETRITVSGTGETQVSADTAVISLGVSARDRDVQKAQQTVNGSIAKIRQALEKKFGQATIILISHRMTTLSKADQVLVLDHGRVAQLGTPEELRNQPGLYQEIDRIQSLSREEETA